MTGSTLRWPGACDCHLHVYEDGFALAPTATFKPPHAPVSAYREVRAAIGTQRAVVVQPTGYGFDNRCTLQAVRELGPGTRAIVVVPPGTTALELESLHLQGARGVRFMMLGGGVLPWETLEGVAAAIAPFGWNINLQLDGHDLPLYEERLSTLPCALVIDHVGKFLRAPATPQSDGFGALARLLDRGRCWVKLSAPYETSRVGAPGYDDVAVLVRELSRRWPERCLWASNWPHPNTSPLPRESDLLEWALELMGNDAVRRAVLVDNPAHLYSP